MYAKNRQKLQTTHRDLVDQLDFVNVKDLEGFLASLKTLVDDLGDAIYIPDFSKVGDEPAESYSCLVCGSTDLSTILLHEESLVEWQKDHKLNTVFKKTCKACGYVYYIDKTGHMVHND